MSLDFFYHLHSGVGVLAVTVFSDPIQYIHERSIHPRNDTPHYGSPEIILFASALRAGYLAFASALLYKCFFKMCTSFVEMWGRLGPVLGFGYYCLDFYSASILIVDRHGL